jgi:hypothetical protein
VNNDAAFWTEALRSGSRGIDDLTNYVEEITISNSKRTDTFKNTWDVNSQIKTGEQIVGLLSTLKYTNDSGKILTNSVIARVRAINGPAVDKRKPTNEFVFRYQLESEVTPVSPAPVYTPGKTDSEKYQFWQDTGANNVPYHLNVAGNLSNIRLTFRWPVFEQGNTWGVGRNRRTVRSLANGRMTPTARDDVEHHTNYHLAHPNNYQYVSDRSEITTP